jgi:hypothetical protein
LFLKGRGCEFRNHLTSHALSILKTSLAEPLMAFIATTMKANKKAQAE